MDFFANLWSKKKSQPSKDPFEERVSLVRYLVTSGLFDADKLEKYLSMEEKLSSHPVSHADSVKTLKAAQATPPIQRGGRLVPSYEFLRWRFAEERIKELKKLIDQQKRLVKILPPRSGQTYLPKGSRDPAGVLAEMEDTCRELERWAFEERALSFQGYPSR